MPERKHSDWMRLGAAITPRWTPDRASALKTRIALRHSALKWRRIAAAAALFLVVTTGAALSLLLRGPDDPSAVAPPHASPDQETLQASNHQTVQQTDLGDDPLENTLSALGRRGTALEPGADEGSFLTKASADNVAAPIDGRESQPDGLDQRQKMRTHSDADAESPAAPSPAPALATALTPSTRFTVTEGVSHHTYQLVEGMVRFNTGADRDRRLVVHVGALVIEDIGTIFSVEALAANQARVVVSEGRVRVTWPAGQAVVKGGEQGVFPPVSAVVTGEDAPRRDMATSPARVQSDWRVLARRGSYQQAFQILEANSAAVSNQVDDLLLAADVMRFSGRPKRAAGYLEQVVSAHPRDPRADLAAFTLGRVFLDELGRPRQAARAFAAAGRGGSPLAEEALAREVEAWSRAGEVDRARAAAAVYLNKYTHGVRADVVRAFGGMRAP